MGRYRLYADKTNTLIEGTSWNTGESPITELWYGVDGVSRYLIHFDLDTYLAQYALNLVPHISATTSTFNLSGLYPTFGSASYSAAGPATSSEIEVQVVQQAWDSGLGSKFYGRDRITGTSNWYSATTTSAWAAEGGDFLYQVFSGTVDKGYEDVSMDLTDEINLWTTFTGDNYGLVVKFTDAIEALTGSTKKILKYFSENTDLAYKRPYVEFTWDDQVRDGRNTCGLGLTRRLYMYLRRDGIFTSAADVSGVTVTFSHPSYDTQFYAASAITQQYPGVYYIDFAAPSFAGTVVPTFIDTWSVQLTSGNGYSNFSYSGDLVSETSSWSTGQTDVLAIVEYKIHMPNLKPHYHVGEIIYLEVDAYVPYTSTKAILETMEFRICLIDGDEEGMICMHDWSPVSYTTDLNGFPLNLSWFHPNYTYKIEFRYTSNGAIVSISSDEFKFKVVE